MHILMAALVYYVLLKFLFQMVASNFRTEANRSKTRFQEDICNPIVDDFKKDIDFFKKFNSRK